LRPLGHQVEPVCHSAELRKRADNERIAHGPRLIDRGIQISGASLPLPVDPLIIDMMEVDVRQERAGPCGVPSSASVFEQARRQPLGNQSDDSPVANPMFDEADQAILANLVEKGLNVAIEHPVDPPLPDSERERIQRLMLVALGSPLAP